MKKPEREELQRALEQVALHCPLHSPGTRTKEMSTYSKLHDHIVFGTKNRVVCLDKSWRPQLWEYMGGTIRGLGGVPHGVGGYNDHVHLLIDLKPTQVIADVVSELKKASTEWVRQHTRVKIFRWQEGYGVFTVGWRERDVIKRYIADQETHHDKLAFHEEYLAMLKEAGVHAHRPCPHGPQRSCC